MNDALKDLASDLILELDWLSDEDRLADGHRVVLKLQDANNQTMASLSVPSDQLRKAMSQKLKCYSLMTPNGIVTVASDETEEPLPSDKTITLDQLIGDGISSDMLDDEPNAANMLSELHSRLLKSLELVELAIASLPKP
jgi:hypothetical protein